MEFNDFVGLYNLSKTLRFEAIPVGATRTNIYEGSLLKDDEHRAESYQIVKKLIDEYHKDYIDRTLTGFQFDVNDLSHYRELYSQKASDLRKKDEFEKLQVKLRGDVSSALKNTAEFKRICKKELIREDLFQFFVKAGPDQLCGLSRDEADKVVLEFRDFTTYFTGFHQNRANIYTSEEHSTGIPYRLINDNLPRFLDNMEVFERIMEIPEFKDCLEQLFEDFKQYLDVDDLAKVFELKYYNMVLTQIKIDLYNSIIGGRTEKNSDKKIQGLNEYINLYNQRHSTAKLPKFKTLYKQILSDRVAVSWLPEEFESDQELIDAIRNCYETLQNTVLCENGLKHLLESIDSFNLDGIFIKNDSQLSEISQRHYKDWGLIQAAIKTAFLKEGILKRKKAESEEEFQKRSSSLFKRSECFSIAYIDNCVKALNPDVNGSIADYFRNLNASNDESYVSGNVFCRIEDAYLQVADLLNNPYPNDKNLCQNPDQVELIKALLDSLKDLQRFVKPLIGAVSESGKDERFYGELFPLWAELDIVSHLYDKVRNRVVRKPYSTKKIKLNFDNAQLFGGWDENKLNDYGCSILRRNGLYYVAIMDKQHKKLLGKEMPCDGDCYERMVYKYFKDITTMVPKCSTQLKEVHQHFQQNKSSESIVISGPQFKKPLTISKEVYELNNKTCNGKKKFQVDYLKQTGDKEGYTDAVGKWIKFCKEFLSCYDSTTCYDLSSLKSEYERVDEFYRDVNQLVYKVEFRPVSVRYINTLVEEGKMYLFQLYNKDFSEYSKGTPNMHTLYWKALFDDSNLASRVYMLNGQAELFFRKASIKYTRPTHKANEPIACKNANNLKKESCFEYDLVKDKRYTEDKFMFHVPITLNFRNLGENNLNQRVREYLKDSSDTHIIGIDRGERHLLYLVVIDGAGKIVEQYSLNEICNEYRNNTYKTDYHALLDSRESERQAARQSWKTIESIKELKEGYLSQVIHKIAQLMVKYHSIVVLEDLNGGFKRSRQKVEKQVYQKFEKMLIDKLNYLVDKRQAPDEVGGIYKAYQLTSKFESFNKLGKQSGFLFYVPAWNTSKIDPKTGFVNLFDTKYRNVDESRKFFDNFDSITYNPKEDRFEFAFDYGRFDSARAKAEGTRTKWTISTHGDRIETKINPQNNNQWDSKSIDLTKAYKDLFNEYCIDICGNLKEQIVSQDDKHFFEGLLNCLKLTLQMRNSITGTEIDYLISPVIDEHGTYYDSRYADQSLPLNADANGAFNIARKGLLIIEQIKNGTDTTKLDLSNKTWLKMAQRVSSADE